MIEVLPITVEEAKRAVKDWHRTHDPPLQTIFRLGAFVDGELVGAATIERPKAPGLCTSRACFEVSRLACRGGGRLENGHVDGVASRLLGACWATMRGAGARRLVSSTRVDEDGTCYRAAGWVAVALIDGREWNTGNKSQRWLPGLYEPTTEIIDRIRWEIGPDAALSRVARNPFEPGLPWVRIREISAT